MDNGLPLFNRQSRYVLDINNSTVTPDVLHLRGREALSRPFSWDIEFTTEQANITPAGTAEVRHIADALRQSGSRYSH